ncbi:MAG: M15 family metallopeptidase, partial [Rhodobacterales bacterium]
NTAEALTAWRSARAGASAAVERVASPHQPDAASIPTQAECSTYYGQPGTDEIRNQLVYVTLPFDLRIDWALDQTTRRIRVHAKAAASLERALLAVFDHYGSDDMRDLGIDRFAGSYVERRMRGGASWSMHSYGCAVDFYAAPNALRLRCPHALFCGAAYKPLLDIMQANEWLPALRLWGADAMHFQRARM